MNTHYLESFFQQINTDTVILTPNRRLSATLHKMYQQYQLTLNQQTFWLTPQILPINAWIQQLWNDITSKTFLTYPLLLSISQEQLLWERIILNTKDNEQLLQISETADLARSAWILLMQWQIDIHHPLFHSSEDYAALHCWIMKFKHLCKENNYIDAAVLPDHITNHIKSGEIIAPKCIMIYGFTEFSPQLNHLLKTCEEAGSEIIHITLDENQEKSLRISLLDSDEEIQTLARWAKSIYQKNPGATIGCVIPTLDKIRDRVLQIFSEVFATNDTYTVDTQACPFNISAGKSLSQYPIINTALQALSLHKKNISTEILSHILTTPFIGEGEIERVKRAYYDSQLRLDNKSSINIETISHEDCHHLAKRLQKFLSIVEDHRQKNLTHGKWTEVFCEMLTALGWPGERSLNSEEYQVVESWLDLLCSFTALDQVSQPVNLYHALSTLQKMATRAVFQPKSPETTIQVLGILEAAALPFDYLWIAGFDDVSWPPQPKPNPFIPKRIQRDLRMPHATAERELSFCNIITKQFKQSASHVIFSHAEKNEALELQPSPLIKDLEKIKFQDLQLEDYTPPSLKIFHSKNIEILIDDRAPEITNAEKIRGGVSIIKQQALCPFKAFAEWRLQAHELESPLPGLRAKDRGNVIHKTLEILWNQLQDHASLVSLDDRALDNLILASVDQALNLVPNSHSELTQYISLEKQRLHGLIKEWLKVEKQRPPFKINMNEKAVQFTIGPLPITIRIDRIDELEDGSKLIIDYKTGKNNEISSWFSERPEEPQLPLYSLLDSDLTSAITFAQVHPGEHYFKGVSHYAIDIKGINPISEIRKATASSWRKQLSQWKSFLTKLSEDFYHGDARVDPKDEQTCEWCQLKSLCRINEDIESVKP